MTVQGSCAECVRMLIQQVAVKPGDITILTHYERTNTYAIIMPPPGHAELERLEGLGYNILIKTRGELILTSLMTYLQRWLTRMEDAQIPLGEEAQDDLPKRS